MSEKDLDRVVNEYSMATLITAKLRYLMEKGFTKSEALRILKESSEYSIGKLGD